MTRVAGIRPKSRNFPPHVAPNKVSQTRISSLCGELAEIKGILEHAWKRNRN
jgi:hypothetical protein